MRFFYILFWVSLLPFAGCNSQNTSVSIVQVADPVTIRRFDKELLQLIETSDTFRQASFAASFPHMLDLLGKGVLNMASHELPGFYDRLVRFYSEPTLRQLYADAVWAYDKVDDIELQLGQAFAFVHTNLPAVQLPEVYMHVSGLSQNILVGEHSLSLSIDKYLGEDYSLYQEFFYSYQLRKMTRRLVVPDYLAGLLLSEYPFEGKESILLERIVHEGKIKYLLGKAFPDYSVQELMGYAENETAWCEKHEKKLWRTILGRKHLYTPDLVTTNSYLQDAPCTFLADEAPGSIGVWLGLQIVTRYMDETNASAEALMSHRDAQEILTLSKYKP